jgi:hypothetical protein
MTKTANEIGDDSERRVLKILQGERVKQSGGGKFFKSDVRDRLRIIWEVKGTSGDGFRVTRDLLRKARDAARGMKGTGDNYLAGVIIVFEDGKAYEIMELEDHVSIITADPSDAPRLPASKAAERRARGRGSLLGP